jgi:diguanylate cyclase (GGDEF)-like protein
MIVASALVRVFVTERRPPSQAMALDIVQSTFTYLNLIFSLGAAAGLLWLSCMIQQEDLFTRANTDGLTSLLNRHAFDERLARELYRAKTDLRSIPLLLADIDFFKRVNDTLGHPAGDKVLRRVADALRRVLRPSDILARFGGEEFAIMLREPDLHQATEVAERLRVEVADLKRLPGDLRITISIGLALSAPGESHEQLINRCDQALYRAKSEGRNRVCIAPSGPEAEPTSIPSAPRLVPTSDTQRSA